MPVPLALPAVPIIAEAIKGTLIVMGVIGGGVIAADQIKKANDRAKSQASDAAPATTCQTCRRNNPCAASAGGVPGTKFQGGAHGYMKGPKGDGLDSHHMPSKDASPLSEDMGPAIKMTPEDHRETASHGSGPDAIAYRATQRRLIAQGNFTAAFAMDVADIRSQFGSKYDGAIVQATAYMECLKKHGVVR